MKFELTPRRADEFFHERELQTGGAISRSLPLIAPGHIDLEGPVFAEGPESMDAHALDAVRSMRRTAVDPGLPLYSARDAFIVSDSFVVVEKRWLLFTRFGGDELRQPEPHLHASLKRDAGGRTYLDASEDDVDHLTGRHILAYWEPARMYHHWLFECLSRIVAALSIERLDDAKLLLPRNVPRFAIETLRLLGIDEERITYFDPTRICRVDELLMIPIPRFDLDVCGGSALNGLRQAILPRLPPSPLAGRHLIFSRKDALSGERLLINEDEVVDRLEREGYESVELTAYSVAEQLSIAHHAATVACVHGSAGANLLFASPETRVLHLFPDCVYYFYSHGIGTAIAGAPYAYLYGLSFQRRIRYHNNPWLLSADRVVKGLDRLRAA